MEKKRKGIEPVNINDKVWFYPVGKRFEFVVNPNPGLFVQFELPFRKIRKFIA